RGGTAFPAVDFDTQRSGNKPNIEPANPTIAVTSRISVGASLKLCSSQPNVSPKTSRAARVSRASYDSRCSLPGTFTFLVVIQSSPPTREECFPFLGQA